MHVQKLIVKSGRRTLSQRKFDNIRAGLIELKTRCNREYREMSQYYDMDTDEFKNNPAYTTAFNDTYTTATIFKNGKPMRVFSLVVSKAKDEPIPFGHLLKTQEVT